MYTHPAVEKMLVTRLGDTERDRVLISAEEFPYPSETAKNDAFARHTTGKHRDDGLTKSLKSTTVCFRIISSQG